MSIHSLVIESQGKRIIVDTCIGNDKVRSNPAWNKLQLPFLQDLQKHGYPREAIDHVICTHLHIDHVGWNTMLKNDKWVATFPNAKYLLGGTEWDFFSRSRRSVLQDPVDDSVRPVMAEGLSSLVDDKHRDDGRGMARIDPRSHARAISRFEFRRKARKRSLPAT